MGTDGKPSIWLRYTTQFTTGGRTHSIEMGIPVPVGASAEMREQLIREAESGMDQLTRHVENRVAQMMQRAARPSEPATRTPAAAGYPAASSGTTPPVSPTGRPQSAGPQFTTPPQAESQAAPHEASHAPQAPQPAVPPTRQTVGANMPSTPGIPGDANGNMKLGQFMQFIRETWGLTPKQAMDLLNVKSLNGLNYREVLRQLQPLVEQQGNNAQSSNQKPPAPGPIRTAERPSNPGTLPSTAPSRPMPPAPERVPGGTRAGQTPEGTRAGQALEGTRAGQATAPTENGGAAPVPGTAKPIAMPKPSTGDHGDNAKAAAPQSPATAAKAPIVPIHMVRDDARKYKFDEEDDEEEADELSLAEEGDDDDKEQKLAMARIKLDELKEVRGASAANPARLAVLHNILDSQIDNEQLTRLIQATWGTTTVKKLKVDQVEALISWAKEDYFVDEVEDVLDLIDAEEPYASRDW